MHKLLLGVLLTSLSVLPLPVHADPPQLNPAAPIEIITLAEDPSDFLLAQQDASGKPAAAPAADPAGAGADAPSPAVEAAQPASGTDPAAQDDDPGRAGEAAAADEDPEAEGGEEFTVLVKEIVITGNTVIDTPTLQQKVEPFRNTEMTLEEMGELADLITIAYQEEGYILARAYLPEQEIQKGALTIAVQEGKIGKVMVAGGRHFDERVIRRYFKPQQKLGIVNESLLEKGLLLSSEIPSVKTGIVLREGEQPGEVDVVINTEDTSEVTFGANASIDYNNFGSEVVSEDRYGVNLDIVDHNWGAELNVRAVTGNTSKASTLVTSELRVPVGPYGTKAAFNYLDGNYIVGQEYADLGLTGNTENWGVKVIHPFIKKKNMNLDLELGWVHKYSEQYELDERTRIDEYDGFYVTADFDNLDRFLGKNIASLQYFYGNMNWDGLDKPSRSDVTDNFQRITLNLARIQKVYGYSNALVRAWAQYSTDRLPSPEQSILGGYGSVRGHAPSTFLGDSGYGISGEFLFAPPFISDKNLFGQRLAQLVQFALFFDHGAVENNDPQEGETDSETLNGYGGGVRIFYKDKFSFKYDIAFPVDPLDGEPDYYNYFTGSLKFF